MDRKVDILTDNEGNKIVFIHDKLFKGKSFDWDDVEKYLKKHIGEFYNIEESADVVYIGDDLPNEYAHSNYSMSIKGATRAAKANAIVGLSEMIESATNKKFTENRKTKHNRDAKYGWYSYESRFAIPVFNDFGELERYNIFRVIMVVRHDQNGKKYLYDIMNIKKETSSFFGSEDLTQ